MSRIICLAEACVYGARAVVFPGIIELMSKRHIEVTKDRCITVYPVLDEPRRGCGLPVVWYAIAAVRVAFGVLLLSVAKTSRAPRTLRVVAFIPLVDALATPFVGVEHARATIEWWSLQGSSYVRLSAIPLLALGGFVAYACAPARRAA
jgi:hypothetical protein